MSSRDGAMNAPIFVGNGSKVKDSLWMMSQPSATARLRLNHNEETDPSLGTLTKKRVVKHDLYSSTREYIIFEGRVKCLRASGSLLTVILDLEVEVVKHYDNADAA
ncbi:hypothetical protein Goshw_024512 [Gossypium schwendimanii]|uniref:Uncharacterized protein n=1 Tax=Gossypium schwendimanii TaxID=34291 RepID=A0A7J9KNB9_GOSSC|nr:hypothetical protein [Gossypium schwendimanii]